MKKRTPVQILVAGSNGQQIVVLADDGSLWLYIDGEWYPLPALPVA